MIGRAHASVSSDHSMLLCLRTTARHAAGPASAIRPLGRKILPTLMSVTSRIEPALLRTAINITRFGFPGSSQGKTAHEHVEHGGEQESNSHHDRTTPKNTTLPTTWPNSATASPTPLAAG